MTEPRTEAPGPDAKAPDGAGKTFAGKLGMIGDAVMIRHTLFSLPFALSALLLETGGHPPLGKTVWILLAAASARNAANAINRIVDRTIDARNPRTAGRHLPSGRLAVKDLGWFSAAMLAVFVFSTAMLGPLCLALLPVAGILVFGYSYTKRFTWLCHAWLGLTCSAATMGAFIAIAGRFEFRYFVMTGAVAAWVCGFDIIYALQDVGVDRAQKLHSIPARFGPRIARLMAAACHLAAVAGFAAMPFFWEGLGAGYWLALALASALLVAEQVIARGGTGRHIRIAAYSINEIIPIIYDWHCQRIIHTIK